MIMYDVITYSKNVSKLPAEMSEKLSGFLRFNDDGSFEFDVCKTFIVKNDQGESIAWLRIDDPQNVSGMEYLQPLAVCEHDPVEPLKIFDVLFADAAATAIYDRVYDQTPLVVIEDGVEHTIKKPRHFCELAYCHCPQVTA